ncbi:MAG: monovalent cation/H(+) antiporter subunit G [Aestuariivita sp.]|uniref:monovalent cation/H(+) antiporter subunit G n=1 Tax=Aestuariivita sp. TaxID=1872407 RepID=UPI003BB09714
MSAFIAGVLLILGGAFTLVAGIGIFRMPDVFIRMHASTKVGTLGSGLILAAVAVYFQEPSVIFKVVLVILFLVLTAPIGAHMIGRAALRIGIEPWGIKKPDTAATPDKTDS